jgi:hypothetical protein
MKGSSLFFFWCVAVVLVCLQPLFCCCVVLVSAGCSCASLWSWLWLVVVFIFLLVFVLYWCFYIPLFAGCLLPFAFVSYSFHPSLVRGLEKECQQVRGLEREVGSRERVKVSK